MANPESPDFQPTVPPSEPEPHSQPEILARLEEAVAAIHNSETFRRYLDMQSRFHRYSFGNTLLILMQRPAATQVAGFHAWRKLGRFVKKGEKGIRIIVPHVRKVDTEADEEAQRVTGFGVGTIFDITQTDGEPLPAIEVPVLEGEEGQAFYDQLAELVAAEGLSLERRPAAAMPDDVIGFYTPGERSIVVREAAPLQMTKTLAHELAHHYTGLTDATRSEHETIAESVSYLVCAHVGLDTGTRSFPYVATWSQDPTVFKQALGSIQRVSAQMIDGLEHLAPRAPEPTPNDSPPPAISEVLYAAPTASQPEPPPAAPPVLQPRLF